MRLLFAGDLTASGRIKEVLLRGEFDRIMPDLAPVLNDVDYSVVNLETPIVRDGIGSPILKTGPHLSAPIEMLELIKTAGFKCVALANNHILDYGGEALTDTLSLLDEKGIDYVGAGDNLEDASRVLIKQIGKEKVAIINVCEVGFNMAGEDSPGAYPLDVVKNARQIQFARQNADYVVVVVHGGLELYRLPPPRMVETYRYFIEIGADAIVTHHQHCCSGYEIYNGRPIFYGLGNLCMDRGDYSNRNWYFGYLAVVDFNAEISIKIIPYSQNMNGIGVRLLQGEEKDTLLKEVEAISQTIADSKALQSSFDNYTKNKRKQVLFRFSQYTGKLPSVLALKGLLNVTPSKKRALRIFEYLSNDSHRSVAQDVFSSLLQ